MPNARRPAARAAATVVAADTRALVLALLVTLLGLVLISPGAVWLPAT